MSTRHASLVHRPGGFWIDDEKSMNGTFVDGTLVEEKRRLPDSAVLRTGGTLWRFTALEPPPDSEDER
jgi:pSer/pThr/pTyr-binding forkhead associated (FHA) protein